MVAGENQRGYVAVRVGLEVLKLNKKLYDKEILRRVIDNTLTATAKDIKVDLGVVTQTWNHRPNFIIKLAGRNGRTITTDDKAYYYVNKGTPAHLIAARNVARLAFQSGYTAKTQPRLLASKPGGASGPVVYTRVVRHPGTEAREFDKTTKAKWDALLPGIFERALLAEIPT